MRGSFLPRRRFSRIVLPDRDPLTWAFSLSLDLAASVVCSSVRLRLVSSDLFPSAFFTGDTGKQVLR